MNFFNFTRRRTIQPPPVKKITASVRHKRRKIFSNPGIATFNTNCPTGMPVSAAIYEAADLYKTDKSWLTAYIQGAKADLPVGERLELVRKARWFEKNSPPMQKALDLIEGNVVGVEGITCSRTVNAKFAEYDKLAKEAWTRFSRQPDPTSKDQLPDTQAKILRAACVDGDLFIRKIIVDGEPKIRIYESHQCVSIAGALKTVDKLTGKTLEEMGYTEWDGVIFDPRGVPAYYCLASDEGSTSSYSGTWDIKLNSPELVPAKNVIHAFEPSRAGQARGTSMFAAGIRPLHDLDDIQTMELRAVRSLADVATIIKMDRGEADAEDTGISLDDTPTETTADDAETRKKYYQETFGGRTIILDKDDDHKNTDVIRPSAQMQQLWVYLQDQFCKSIGLSYAALSDYNGSWGGAALRGAIVADNRFYSCRSKLITSVTQELYEFVVGYNNIRIASTTGVTVPPDWAEVRWHSPRRNTVDIGYSFESTRGEIAAGINTYQNVAAERGLDYEQILRQRAIEEQLIKKLAAEYGVDRNLIAALGPNERPAATAPTSTPIQL